MTEIMKKFLEESTKEPEFAEKLAAVETPEDLLALAAEKGFSLTVEDIDSMESTTGEVSDDELDDVTGGLMIGGPSTVLLPRFKWKGLKANDLVYHGLPGQIPTTGDLVYRGQTPTLDNLVFRGGVVNDEDDDPSHLVSL